MSTFQLPQRLVRTVTLKGGKVKEKEEGKTAYAERCEIAVRNEIVRTVTESNEAISQILAVREGMRLPFNPSTAEAAFMAMPETVNGWCTDRFYDLVNWNKVAANFNNLVEVCELL